MAVTETEAREMIERIVWMWHQYRTFLVDSAGEHFTGSSSSLEVEFNTKVNEEFTNRVELQQNLESFRAQLAGAKSQFVPLFRAALAEYSKVIDTVETDPVRQMQRLYDYFIDNSQTVESRGFTHNNPSMDGSNAGDGVVYKLYVTPDGAVIENSTAEVKTIKCIADGGSGATLHEELFEIVGEEAERDNLYIDGSGRRTTLNAISGLSTAQLIENPSFDEGTSATSITGWTVSSGVVSNTAKEQTDPTPFRDTFGVASADSWALEFTTVGDVTIEQDLMDRGISFSAGVPVFLSLRVYTPTALTAGTLTITLGDQTYVITLNAETDDVWTTHIFGSETYTAGGTENWFDTFRTSGELKVKIAAASLAGASVYIDDLCMREFHPFDGSWWAILGGATAFVQDDFGTCTDTLAAIASRGLIQDFLCEEENFEIPHTASPSETWSDPTGTP